MFTTKSYIFFLRFKAEVTQSLFDRIVKISNKNYNTRKCWIMVIKLLQNQGNGTVWKLRWWTQKLALLLSVPRKSPKLPFKPCCRMSIPLRRIITFRTFGVLPGRENDSWKSAVNKNSKQVKFLAAFCGVQKNISRFLVHHRVSLDEISGILIFHHVPRIFDSARS